VLVAGGGGRRRVAPAPAATSLAGAEAWAALAPDNVAEPWPSAEQRAAFERFCAWLCEESARAAAHAATQALYLASLALRVAELAPAAAAWRSRLLGYVWAFVANALRGASDLAGAEAGFGAAWRLWYAGAADGSPALAE
jgi:hypothetical protein